MIFLGSGQWLVIFPFSCLKEVLIHVELCIRSSEVNITLREVHMAWLLGENSAVDIMHMP